MGGGDLNLKKSWHPQTLRNVEKVWKAEQKAEVESKKIEQLRKELEEERAREEMQRHAVQQGIAKKKGERLDWMYAAAGSSQVDHELYLLGKPVDKAVDPMAKENEEDALAPGASFMNDTGANTANDLAAKVRDDPLFLIKRKEEEKRKELLHNPVKMKQLKMLLQANLSKSSKKKKEKKKREKEEKKRKKEKNARHSNSDSDDNDERATEKERRRREKLYRERDRLEDGRRDLRKEHAKHRERDRKKSDGSDVESTRELKRKRMEEYERSNKSEEDVREVTKESRRKEKEISRLRSDESNGERDYKNRRKEERAEIMNGGYMNHHRETKRSPDRKRSHKRSRSRSPMARGEWEKTDKPSHRRGTVRSPPRPRRHASHSPSPPKKLRKSPSPDRRKKWQNGGSTLTKHMDAAEKEKRLAAMMDNAKWRDEQRGKNVKRYKEEDAKLEAKEATGANKSASFLNDIKVQSFSSKTTSSVSDRIKRNINSVQRTPAALESFLGK